MLRLLCTCAVVALASLLAYSGTTRTGLAAERPLALIADAPSGAGSETGAGGPLPSHTLEPKPAQTLEPQPTNAELLLAIRALSAQVASQQVAMQQLKSEVGTLISEGSTLKSEDSTLKSEVSTLKSDLDGRSVANCLISIDAAQDAAIAAWPNVSQPVHGFPSPGGGYVNLKICSSSELWPQSVPFQGVPAFNLTQFPN